MIYTVTLNPSLDYLVEVKDFELGKTNRTSYEKMMPGGKGINVSTVLNNLGMQSVAFGFTGGFVGDEINRRLSQEGIVTDFIFLSGRDSRINVKLRNLESTEINGMGPELGKEDIEQLFFKLKELKSGDYLVLAGSIPGQLTGNLYYDIMEYLEEKGVRIVVDAEAKTLRTVLEKRPFLIKPNKDELEQFFTAEISDFEACRSYAERLQLMGAQNVMVSFGKKGAVLLTQEGQWFQHKAPEGQVVNAVGAGDSMVAGFLYQYERSQCFKEAFLWGLAAGSASAFSSEFTTREETLALVKTLL